MNELIEADFDQLLRQASKTASDYLAHAHEAIDRRFGEGYAAKNPQLVASFMQVASADFNTSSTAKVLEATLRSLTESLVGIAEGLRDRVPEI